MQKCDCYIFDALKSIGQLKENRGVIILVDEKQKGDKLYF